MRGGRTGELRIQDSAWEASACVLAAREVRNAKVPSMARVAVASIRLSPEERARERRFRARTRRAMHGLSLGNQMNVALGRARELRACELMNLQLPVDLSPDELAELRT